MYVMGHLIVARPEYVGNMYYSSKTKFKEKFRHCTCICMYVALADTLKRDGHVVDSHSQKC